MEDIQLIQHDVAQGIPLADESVQCVVTSPPYWGLRDYGTAKWEGGDAECDHRPPDDAGKTDKPTAGQREHAGRFAGDCWKCGARRIDAQLGLEKTPEEYVSKMVAVFREVRRVLRKDGTVWLNLGDSYAGSGEGGGGNRKGNEHGQHDQMRGKRPDVSIGLKPKDIVGIPWRVAFALQADGWWLRQDIIWHKPNPMPESVRDRCTKAHEYLFLLAKSERYYYDSKAIAEPAVYAEEHLRKSTSWGEKKRFTNKANVDDYREAGNNNVTTIMNDGTHGRNRRSVWTIATQPYKGAHFATFPEKLVEPCILAGSKAGDIVLDPFCGSGTVLKVALKHGRRGIGIDLKAEYLELAKKRIGLNSIASRLGDGV